MSRTLHLQDERERSNFVNEIQIITFKKKGNQDSNLLFRKRKTYVPI